MSKFSHYIFRRDSRVLVPAQQLQAGGPLETPPLIDSSFEQEIADLYRSTRKTTLGKMFGGEAD